MMKEIFICLKDGFKELFSKYNLKKYLVYSFLALPLILLFVGFFCVSSYAWSVGSDGNLHSDNLIDNSITNFELGAVSYNVGRTYSQNKVSGNYRLRTKNLIDVDSTKTYSLSVPSPYWVIAQGYNNNLQVSSDGTQFNQALPSLSFTGVSQVAIIVRRIDNGNFNLSDITNIDLMFNEGSTPLQYEPYGDFYYSQSNYNDSYSDGYDDATQNIVDGLQLFNALELYYDSAYLFISTDGGTTWANTSGQNYNVSFSSTFDALRVERSADWNANALYYLDISFKSPININSFRIPAANYPQTLQKVVVGDSEYSFTYSYVDGVSYFLTKEMLSGLTTSIKLYFGVNSTTSNGSRYFYVYVDGFLTGIDNYNNGYKDGKASLQPTIDNLNENIEILKTQVKNLTLQLQQGNSSWYSLFFAMADTPFKTASNFLGFEIFGVNLFNALIGFITILAIFWVFKRLIK